MTYDIASLLQPQIAPPDTFAGAYIARMNERSLEKYVQKEKPEKPENIKALENVNITISQESLDYLKQIDEWKKSYVPAEPIADFNVFHHSSSIKNQYIPFSEYLYKNNFYDELSDEEVLNTEETLKQITEGMHSLYVTYEHSNHSMISSRNIVELEMVSSVNALNYFADVYIVSEEIRNGFKDLIKQYVEYNSATIKTYSGFDDRADKAEHETRKQYGYSSFTPNPTEDVLKIQNGIRASAAVGGVSHTAEEREQSIKDYERIFEQLKCRQFETGGAYSALQDVYVSYSSGGNRTQIVEDFLKERSDSNLKRMMSYWDRLL